MWFRCTRAVASPWSEVTTSFGFTWRTLPASAPRSRWANDSWWWEATTVGPLWVQDLGPVLEPPVQEQREWALWLIRTAWWSSGGMFGQDAWESSSGKRRRGSATKCDGISSVHPYLSLDHPSPWAQWSPKSFPITGTLHIRKTACTLPVWRTMICVNCIIIFLFSSFVSCLFCPIGLP